MSVSEDSGARGSFPERALRLAALIGGFALFLIMGLVAVSVIFRYVLGMPIFGSQEIVEIGMSVVVMLAMPFTSFSGSHIRVDIFDRRLGAAGRFFGDLISRTVGIFVLGLLVRKTWDKALDAHEYGDVTNMIEIPVWIAYGAITFGMGLFILVLAGQIVGQIRHGVTGYE